MFAAMLGLMTLGATAPKASANPLEIIPIVGDLLGSDQPLPLPTELDILHDNIQGNSISLCGMHCTPTPGAIPPQAAARPAGIPGQIPPGARPPATQRVSQNMSRTRQPAPGQLPPGARPPAPQRRSQNRPTIELGVPNFKIPL